MIDPAVEGADIANQISASSLTSQLDADGLSVADVLAAAGFSNFATKAADGTVGTAPAAGNGQGSADNDQADEAPELSIATAAPPAATTDAGALDCSAATTFVTVTKPAAAETQAAEAPAKDESQDAAGNNDAGTALSATEGVDPGFQASSLGLDFGTCTPTIKFEAGLNGRSVDEFTFQAIDPVINKGQQEALNFNIIFNRICDQLGNVCGASDDAIAACDAASADLADGSRDVSTADAWNEALGFAGADTNPDNAPQEGLVGHT